MKKSLYIATFLWVLAACSREIGIEVPAGDMTISARTETSADTRTVVEGETHVYWEPGDEIAVFLGDKSTKFSTDITEPSATATFKGTFGDTAWPEDLDLWAVYPFSEDATFDGEAITTVLPSNQVAKAGSFGKDMNLAIAHSTSNTLQFYNVGGGVRFSLAEEGIREVILEGLDGEVLSGKVKVGFQNGAPIIEEITEGKTSITLTPLEGETYKKDTWYYIVAVPGSLENGFKLSFHKTDALSSREFNKAVTIKRNIYGTLIHADKESSFSVPEAVDLGLSVKWASFNLGASAPEEYGDYYAWGDTEPYYSSLDPLTWKEGKEEGYVWSSYKWRMGNRLAKYCNNSSYGYEGFSDMKIVLDPEDDAAAVNLGDKWRMPTAAELEELIVNCTWTWTTQNGVPGRLVTASNGNSIFLPSTTLRAGVDFYDTQSGGYYWSSSLNTDDPRDAWYLIFGPESVYRSNYNYRSYGSTIRPVYGDYPIVHVADVSLDKTIMTLDLGVAETLTAIVSPSDATIKDVTWSSSEESVAIVSSAGVVTGVAAGSAIITVTTTDGGKTATCYVTVTEASIPIPEAVDMGLSVKWASFNLGATKPEEYGDYYAWGETEPKDDYSWTTYKWCMGDWNTMTKYCSNSECGYNGFTDTKTVLDPEDDAAHINLGGNWRMPTDDEWTELRDNCTWSWTTQNGVNGSLVTGINGNTIFLPAAGSLYSEYIYHEGSSGVCWSSSINSNTTSRAWDVYFNSVGVIRDNDVRYGGYTIRPVYSE